MIQVSRNFKLAALCVVFMAGVDNLYAEGEFSLVHGNANINTSGLDLSASFLETSWIIPWLWAGVGTNLFTVTNAIDGYQISDKGKIRIFEYHHIDDYFGYPDTMRDQGVYFRVMKSWFPLQCYWIPTAYLKNRGFPAYLSIRALYCPWSALGSSSKFFANEKGIFGRHEVLDIGICLKIPYISLIAGFNRNVVKEAMYTPANTSYYQFMHIMPYSVSRIYFGLDFSLGKTFLGSKKYRSQFIPDAEGWVPFPALYLSKTASAMSAMKKYGRQGNVGSLCEILRTERYNKRVIDSAIAAIEKTDQCFAADSIVLFIIKNAQGHFEDLNRFSVVLQQRSLMAAWETLPSQDSSPIPEPIKLLFTELEWNTVKKTHTVEAYEAFANKHPRSPMALESRSRIVILKWERACEKNNAPLFRDFLAMPDSIAKCNSDFYRSRVDSARMKISKIEWDNACRQNDLQAYENYFNVAASRDYDVSCNRKIDSIVLSKISMNQNVSLNSLKGVASRCMAKGDHKNLMIIGDVFFNQGEYEEAGKCYRKCSNAAKINKVAHVFLDRGDLAKAGYYFESIGSIKDLAMIAQLSFGKGDYALSALYFDKISDTIGVRRAADMCYDKHDYTTAGRYYDKMNDLQSISKVAKQLMVYGRYDDAEHWAKRANDQNLLDEIDSRRGIQTYTGIIDSVIPLMQSSIYIGPHVDDIQLASMSITGINLKIKGCTTMFLANFAQCPSASSLVGTDDLIPGSGIWFPARRGVGKQIKFRAKYNEVIEVISIK